MKFGAAKAEQRRSGRAVEAAAPPAIGHSAVNRAEQGWRAFFWIAFAGALVGLAVWSATRPNQVARTQAIEDGFGLVVAAGLGVILLGLALGPALLERLRSLGRTLSVVGELLFWLTSPVWFPVLLLDLTLRHWIAWLCGLTSMRWWIRYPLLFAHLALAAGAVVAPTLWAIVPEPYETPIEIAGLAWAFAVLLAVIRKWLWTEAQFDQENEANAARAETLPDLRDEALISLLLFFALIPVVFEQIHDASGGNIFVVGGSSDDYVAWLAFFGAQLMKAVPFVDWAEVYAIGSNTSIDLPEAGSGPLTVDHHIMFVTRIVVDLVLLGTMVHAIERASRLARQSAEFDRGERTRLDPYLQSKLLNRQMRPDRRELAWDSFPAQAEVGRFAQYDRGLLERLAQRGDVAKRGFALHALADPSRSVEEFAQFARQRLRPENGGGPNEHNPQLQTLIVKLLATRAPTDGALLELLIDLTDGLKRVENEVSNGVITSALSGLTEIASTENGREQIAEGRPWNRLSARLSSASFAELQIDVAKLLVRVSPDKAAPLIVERIERDSYANRIKGLAEVLSGAAVTAGLADAADLIARLETRAAALAEKDPGPAMATAIERVRRLAAAWRQTYASA